MSGPTLHLDLSRDARRSYIHAFLLALLDAERRAAVEGMLATCGLPDRHHHDLGEVLESIAGLAVSERVKGDLRAIYGILASAEAQVHGCPLEATHFHEVGNAASIRSSLGICLAIEALDPKKISATPVQVGSGTVRCAHGLLSVPAPATAAILASGVEVCEERLAGELCTPTSAAIIKHFCF